MFYFGDPDRTAAVVGRVAFFTAVDAVRGEVTVMGAAARLVCLRSLNAPALEVTVLGSVAEALAAVALHQVWAVRCLPRDTVVEDHPDFTEPPGIFSGRHKD